MLQILFSLYTYIYMYTHIHLFIYLYTYLFSAINYAVHMVYYVIALSIMGTAACLLRLTPVLQHIGQPVEATPGLQGLVVSINLGSFQWAFS